MFVLLMASNHKNYKCGVFSGDMMFMQSFISVSWFQSFWGETTHEQIDNTWT
jgi:hypothetical protein